MTNITLTQPAVKWFQKEMNTKPGDYIRFYARYGGISPIHPGFSIGITKSEQPYEVAVQTQENGVTFFIEETDKWYFDGYDLHVKFSRKDDQIKYEYR
ncbi:hypothetical protein D7Z54_04590 [Salibacterium salarium]|uniref:Core domain-containing protein n=1 Tax=Salibacterium salarium TaxID=284579 RepID=A0A3R9Q655_9BACI|nr:HesB/YadR/YfhF family protein [Salibacterium salarium]RSL34437.1 hypothetical protein D7Z54_04590 [Salibacterium salarium]